MLRILLLTCCSAFTSCIIAQAVFNKYAGDAAMTVGMIQKFHVQPKAVDKEFSSILFDRFISQLDSKKIYFTSQDVQSLSPYRYTLDAEIKNKQVNFLKKITALYQTRISQADKRIDTICHQPFNFSLAENFTVTEDTSFAAGDNALRTKLYKLVKKSVLSGILNYDEELAAFTPLQQKKFTDSVEVIYRKKINTIFKRSIQRKLQRPGGIQQLVGEEYCKAIAICFDPHTEYMPESEKENFESELGNKTMGFGFNLNEDENGNVLINNLKAGSPAYKSGGLNEGDKIESIQWEGQQPIDVTGASMEEVTRILNVSNHDKALLKIKKADGSSRQVTLWKEKLETDEEDEDKVKSYVLKGVKTVGYISLPAFYEDWENENANVNGCANDVAKEILKLKKENIEGLILDVRYNGGGSMREAVELAGIFIDAGPVAMIKSKEHKVITLKDVNRGTIYDGPLVLMVNGHSASASEMLAGTLQDYNRAIIAGSVTYGKATAQQVLPMDTTITPNKDLSIIKTDSYIKTTVSQLYRVNGTTAQAMGVKPDVPLPDLLEADPERESDEPFALHSGTIEANKYFQPGSPLPVALLQTAAKAKVNASSYFTKVKAYIEAEKTFNQKSEISLRLSDALNAGKQNEPEAPEFEKENKEAAFKILNNDYERQRMKTNSKLAEVNEEWKASLAKDPYVKVVYDLVLLMIK